MRSSPLLFPPRLPVFLIRRHPRLQTQTLLPSRRHLATVKSKMAAEEGENFKFGPYKIDPREVFYRTHFSYAMVNLRPVVPGHILLLSQ
ncbi:hypothetical protein MLD38_021312 [Melastoma candidum]|uniref:Uncharacterized protein n=1 Tax=Melastoma candidum TaxID=119954 RepID=A0ACB9QGX4_9MYRT|nr:hypothetical protein MLD38_021312 [Melastoma candidum]